MTAVDGDLRKLLDEEARRINTPAFIVDDPVQFPRRFDRLADIEIAAILSATIAWGNRRMICRDCDRMLALMDHQPEAYMLDEGYEELDPALNIHRTFFARNMAHYLRGLRPIYQRHGSLQAWAAANRVGEAEAPAWELVRLLNLQLAEANSGVEDSRCLPLNSVTSALKRINMMLRWLVRDDGLVDLGVWDVIRPSQLSIPLDVHVGNTARDLGLLQRKSNDRRAVEEIMEPLRLMRPDDPVIYDFALFGLGMGL